MFALVVDWADQEAVHKLLDCELVMAHPVEGKHLLWVDECALLREPFVYPQFKIRGVNGDCPLTGYGLLTGGWTYEHPGDFDLDPSTIPAVIFEEHWTRRISPDECIDQLLRIYCQEKLKNS
jgi:hypothetical protein